MNARKKRRFKAPQNSHLPGLERNAGIPCKVEGFGRARPLGNRDFNALRGHGRRLAIEDVLNLHPGEGAERKK